MAGRAGGDVPQLGAILVAALVVGAFLLLASPVNATNFSGATGLTGCYDNNKADSAAHGYVSMSPRNASATDWARTYVLDPTDVNTYSDSNTSTTDVLVHDGYYSTLCGFTWFNPASSPGGVVGLAVCGSLSGTACEQFRVYYNQYFTDIANLSDVRGLATHEAGHTLGLLHRTGNTAMQTGYPKPCLCFDPNHDVLHLNSSY